MRVGILRAQSWDELRGKARRGVHRQINGDQFGIANRGLIQRLPGQIDTGDLMAALAEPGCRRDDAEWLTAKFVGRNQRDVHWGSVYRFDCE
jgi:hypothetical protein